MKRTPFLILALLTSVGPLAAHDFWLVPNAFRSDPGEEMVVLGRTSSAFPSSLSAVTPDRVGEAIVLGGEATTQVESVDVSGTSLRLRHRPEGAGDRVVAVRVNPRIIPESAESFREYLVLEGAPELHDRYDRAGLLPTDSILRRYAKYAKTLVSVGRGGTSGFDAVAGHPLEFVPVGDPRAGSEATFRLLFDGRPLTSARVHADYAESLESEGPGWDIGLTTDAEGTVRFPADRPGLWSVRALHIVPADAGSGADWDVHWATYSFGR